jgi:hypothetical protein
LHPCCLNYSQDEDCIRLVFRIERTIQLPVGAIPKKELDDCVNRKIGILNVEGHYRLRKFPTPVENFKKENCLTCEKQFQCSKDDKEVFYCLLHKVSELMNKKREREFKII